MEIWVPTPTPAETSMPSTMKAFSLLVPWTLVTD
jgi:hypothetical protein